MCITVLLSSFSCISNNVEAETSVVKASPLAPLNQSFRINKLIIQNKNNDTLQNLPYTNGFTLDGFQSYFYKNHPEFFKDSESSFPVDIRINVEATQKIHWGFFCLYICTLSLLPSKQTLTVTTDVSVTPALKNMSYMFNLNSKHLITNESYMTLYSPVGWFVGRRADKKNQRVSHGILPPAEMYTELYNEYLSQRILQQLSSLKLTTHK